MNIQKVKSLMLSYKMACWSKKKDRHRINALRKELINEIRSGLYFNCNNWRASFGMGGKPNRSQRKHIKKGGTLYRDGFHWLIAENLIQ